MMHTDTIPFANQTVLSLMKEIASSLYKNLALHTKTPSPIWKRCSMHQYPKDRRIARHF